MKYQLSEVDGIYHEQHAFSAQLNQCVDAFPFPAKRI